MPDFMCPDPSPQPSGLDRSRRQGIIVLLAVGILLGSAPSLAAQSSPGLTVSELTSLQLAQATSPLSQAWELYNAEQYAEAIAQFQAAIAADAADPKPHWGLTLCYNKLRQYPQAQGALDQAVALDPALGFTSPETYNSLRTTIAKNLQRPQTSAPRADADPAAGSSTADTPRQRQDLIAALVEGSTYVAPAMVSVVNLADLDRAAQALEPFTVKFVIVPTVTGERQTYGQEVFQALNLSYGAVIVATERGVDVYGDGLTADQATALAQGSQVNFTATDYTSGLLQLAQAAQAASPAPAKPLPVWTWGLGAGVLGVGAWGVQRRRQRGLQQKIKELEALRYQVSEQLDDRQNYLRVLPDAANTTEAQRLLHQVSAQFIDASDGLDQPPRTWKAVQALETQLQAALVTLRQVQSALDRASGQPAATTPQADAQGDPYATPQTDTQGTCFFCSRPLALDLLQPRTLNLKPRSRRVLCCPPCAAQVDTDTPPKLRTVRDGDRYRPWYQSNNYDPYRDYYRYDRDWHSTKIYDLEIDLDQDDTTLQQVVIFADQTQYRDYQVQQVEQNQDWQPSPARDPDPGETSSETDFFWASDPSSSEPEVDEIPEVTDFFQQDPS